MNSKVILTTLALLFSALTVSAEHQYKVSVEISPDSDVHTGQLGVYVKTANSGNRYKDYKYIQLSDGVKLTGSHQVDVELDLKLEDIKEVSFYWAPTVFGTGDDLKVDYVQFESEDGNVKQFKPKNSDKVISQDVRTELVEANTGN